VILGPEPAQDHHRLPSLKSTHPITHSCVSMRVPLILSSLVATRSAAAERARMPEGKTRVVHVACAKGDRLPGWSEP
jgi:hypothetical protein